MTGMSGTAFDMAVSITDITLTVAYCVVVGMLGDHWYNKKIERLAAEGRLIPPGPEKQNHVKKGGTSIAALIVCLLLLTVLRWMNDMLL